MQKLVKEYLDELNKKQKKNRRVYIAMLLLVVMVVGGVIGSLTQYGIAMTDTAECGIEEHQHGEECYSSVLTCGSEEYEGHIHTENCYQTEQILICELEETEGTETSEGHLHDESCYTESQTLVCESEENEGHTHGDACYESQISCGKEEHIHTDACYVDTNADVENAEVWNEQYRGVEWTERWAEDLVTAARMQLGYEESSKNYIAAEDGSHKGYTRYGEFVGDAYRDWNAAFVNFCMYYAGMTESGIFPDEMEGKPKPQTYPEGLTDAARWFEEFKKINEQNEDYLNCQTDAGDYKPEAGDIIFLREEDRDRMGIVSSYKEDRNEILVIEGDSENQVKENTYDVNDENIKSYLMISELENINSPSEERMDEENTAAETVSEEEGDMGPADGQEEDVNELSEEDQKKVDEVIAMIAALPSEEEIAARFEEIGDSGDEDAYDNYFQEIYMQAAEVYEAYMALTDIQKKAVTNADQLMQMEWLWGIDTLDEKDAETAWKVLEGDKARVTEIQITNIADGTAPFDENEADGNDSNSNNLRVRTFDTVTYDFEVKMASWDASDIFREAFVKMEFVLPLTSDQATFDLGAMAWIDKTRGEPQITTEEREISIDGKTEKRTCQILTCYKHLLPSNNNKSVVPGSFGENVTVNVKSMKNGESFQPIFSAAMDGNTWDGICEDHGETEKKQVVADKVTVTAAPKYNIQLRGDASYNTTFDFSTGNDQAPNKDKGSVSGRLLKYGIALQLYNDNRAKGLKGIELPDTSKEITFELNMDSTYTINQPTEGHTQGEKVDVSDEYEPILWSSGSVKGSYGQANEDGRIINESQRCVGMVPYSKGNSENTCKDSGTWKVTQKGKKIKITVSGYAVDPDNMPVRNADWGSKIYGTDIGIGCFSTQEIWILQPFNRIGDSSANPGPEYDIVKQYGQGAFNTTVKATDLKITTISDQKFADPVGTNSSQTKQDDDGETYGVELVLPGSLQNRIRYASAENRDKGVGIDDSRNGRDFACIGTDIEIMSGFTYNTNNCEDNQLYWGTNLTKFYGSAMEPIDTGEDYYSKSLENSARIEELKIFYATKKDGRDWKDDNELKYTYESELTFYDKMKDIPDGHVCIGILYCFKGPGASPEEERDSYPGYYVYHKARVKNDKNLIGDSYSLVSTSRVWTKEMLKDDNGWRNMFSSPNSMNWEKATSMLKKEHVSGNIGQSTFYIKTEYDKTGKVTQEHNSDWSHWGDTLKIIAYKTGITKHLMQESSEGKKKDTFNLDAEQRVVDFKLTPRTYYGNTEGSGEGGMRDTLTIVDTLPKHLTYLKGSAYKGGSYTQIYKDGGTQGQITGGEQFEPEVINNNDGTQTLTWKIEEVSIGAPLPDIYYSAYIGSKDPSIDVPAGTTNLLNKVYITSWGDRRDHSIANGNYSEAGIAVTRGQASAFGKYTKQKVVEKNGTIDYVVYYNNNSEYNGTHVVMMDTMPSNGVNGSHFTGDYEIKDWKIDIENCDIGQVKIYYTTDERYKNGTTKEVKEEEIKEWNEVSVDKGTGKIQLNDQIKKNLVAWAVIGNLGAHKSFNIEMQVQLLPVSSAEENGDNNFYVNLLSSGDTTTKTETPTVKRTLEGLTWLDYNRNGIQDIGEESDRISGIKVELLKLIGDSYDPAIENNYEPVKDKRGKAISVETGNQISLIDNTVVKYETGRYKFTDLPEGIFAVRFVDGNGEYKITQLNATDTDCGDDDTVDSDGVPVQVEGGKPSKTVILNILMPKADRLVDGLYESPYHDSGFYPDTSIEIQKQDENGKSLAGASFTVSDIKNSGPLLSFDKMTTGDGGYKLKGKAEEPVSLGKYYIAAYKGDFVIGMTEERKTVLKKKDDGLIFEVFLQPDGTYSFKYGDGYWLDVTEGKEENGNPVQMWKQGSDAGGTNVNQKWNLKYDGNGNCTICMKKNNNYVLDVSGGNFWENNKLQMYWTNNTEAQKWRLVPALSEGDPQSDSNVVLQVNDQGKLTIKNLIPGEYAITEVRSPDGYVILSEPIQIRLKKDNSIELIKNNDMIKVETSKEDTGEIQLIIKNRQLYELPSAGGSGIYWYMFSGMLLMAAAILMAYRTKCK